MNRDNTTRTDASIELSESELLILILNYYYKYISKKATIFIILWLEQSIFS